MTGVLTSKNGTSVNDAPGLKSGSIGVREKLDAYCNQVDTATFFTNPQVETLVLALDAGGLKDGFGPLKAKTPSLQLKMRSKGTVTIEATATASDGSASQSFTYTTSSAVVGGPVKWDIPTGELLFDTLKLKSVKGAFSLESGTTFPLMGSAEQVLPCGGSISEEGSGTTPGVTVTQLDADGCGSFDVILTNGPNEAKFLKPLDEKSATAQFILNFEWTVDPANTGDTASPVLPDTTIDYESDGDPLTPVNIPLRWCPSVERNTSGAFTGITDVQTNAAAADQDALPGKQFTCILSQDSIVKNSGGKDTVTVTQQVYLLGDAAYRFG